MSRFRNRVLDAILQRQAHSPGPPLFAAAQHCSYDCEESKKSCLPYSDLSNGESMQLSAECCFSLASRVRVIVEPCV
jgi:hypothetical protein